MRGKFTGIKRVADKDHDLCQKCWKAIMDRQRKKR